MISKFGFERRTSNPTSSNAWSIKRGLRGMLVSDGDKKPHLINCEAICVHEEGARIQQSWIRGFRMSALLVIREWRSYGRKKIY